MGLSESESKAPCAEQPESTEKEKEKKINTKDKVRKMVSSSGINGICDTGLPADFKKDIDENRAKIWGRAFDPSYVRYSEEYRFYVPITEIVKIIPELRIAAKELCKAIAANNKNLLFPPGLFSRFPSPVTSEATSRRTPSKTAFFKKPPRDDADDSSSENESKPDAVSPVQVEQYATKKFGQG